MSQPFKTKEKFARLICDECIALTEGRDSGERFLTEEQYDRQLDDPNRGWRCPSCGCYPCRWDDEYFERELVATPSPINIFGIYSGHDLFPIMELLHKDYDNRSHENHVEIARRFFSISERRYACILLCYDGGSSAYTF